MFIMICFSIHYITKSLNRVYDFDTLRPIDSKRRLDIIFNHLTRPPNWIYIF